MGEARGLALAAAGRLEAAWYEQVIGELPRLLGGADALFRLARSDVRREALLSYVSAYAVAAKLLTK